MEDSHGNLNWNWNWELHAIRLNAVRQ